MRGDQIIVDEEREHYKERVQKERQASSLGKSPHSRKASPEPGAQDSVDTSGPVEALPLGT